MRESCHRYYEAHKAAILEWQKQYRLKNRTKILLYYRRKNAARKKEHAAYLRARNYGLDIIQYDALITRQQAACAICRSPFSETPHVDHSHESGSVRGLLCRKCNAVLGMANDDARRLRLAADYLERYG